MRKKAVPVGIEDFKELIQEGYYYIDKTLLIDEMLMNKSKVTLFTRPRRFGKTLNMSMLKYFFDVKDKEENKKLFENLKVSDSEYMSEQGKYLVIFISMKDLKRNSWEETFNSLKSLISDLYAEFKDIREKINERDKMKFDKIFYEEEKGNYGTSLKLLSNYLYEYYGKSVIILIDEYDAPIINAFDKGYYNEAINFFQTFYSSALKTNNSLKYGILTGITRIIKEGIFSGLNNLYVNTILSKDYSEYFGLLESEVVEMLEYFDMKYKIEEVREWYDGYIFGESEVYNPWSIVNYVRENAPEEMEFFNKFVDKELFARLDTLVNNQFDRITYTEAIEILKNAKKDFEYEVEWGIDLQTEHERYLAEEHFKKPVFVTDYPKDIKAFYMKLNEDGKTVRAVDLLAPGIGEIVGGSQREDDYDILLGKIHEMGLKEEDYWWYLDLRKYGSVPHSGFGLGFDRMLMYITGMTNIRDVIPFPRTTKNLEF